MTHDWLWDRNIPADELNRILRDEEHWRFFEIAALLLSRKNNPRDVFNRFLDKKVFVQNWAGIKKQMRRNNWNDPRIAFWQAVYEHLRKTFRKEGVTIRPRRQPPPATEICSMVGHRIKTIRKESGLTQQALSERMGISQQIISRIERGRDNVSLETLQRLGRALGKQLVVDLR